MAISATTAEDTWFNGQKTRLGGFGGGIYATATSGNTIVDNLIDADAVVSSGCRSSTPTKLLRQSVRFRDASSDVINYSDADDTDDENEVIRDSRTNEEEYYGRRLLDALNAAAVVPTCRVELPFRRKKSYLFKRKRRPSLSNVVEIYEHGSAAASGGDRGAVFSGECERRGGGGDNDGDGDVVVQNSKTRSVYGGDAAGSVGGAASARENAAAKFATVAEHATSLISVYDDGAGGNARRGCATGNRRLLSSACDLREDGCVRREEANNACSDLIKNRNASLSKSWYVDTLENFQFANNGSRLSSDDRNAGEDADDGDLAAAEERGSSKSSVNYARSRRRTCTGLAEDEYNVGEIGVDSEERVVLLQRSASVPDDDALSTPPAAKRTAKATSATRLDNVGDSRNAVPLLSPSRQQPAATTMTSSATKLGRWSKSKIDLKVPSFKSLVTMATNKLSASRPANLNYWRNGGGGNHCASSSRFDGRMFGSPVNAATLRRNISLNNVAANRHSVNVESNLKNASSDDIAEMGLLNKKLRKCNTMVALSGGCVGRHSADGSVHMEPFRMVNRLRICGNAHESSAPLSRICSRCSSILSMASSSRYSLNSTHGFFPVSAPTVLCKVCLNEVPIKDSWTLQHCECSYCVDCVRSYVEFEINQGAYSISCPDAQCEKQGIILLEEIESLVSLECIEKHKRYRLNREVEMDKSRTWCPRAGCETVCTLCSTDRCTPQSVHCPTCSMDFCSNCRASWHADSPCKSEEAVPGVTFDSELIKCCPMCSVPIEKDEGCAQMLCKRCKHVFCWYCLASLDDDFLLRHYDKGPCKNKLGHSRASVIWHRTQVISIFAGFGILLLIASPLLLLAAPCIVCCKCRVCTSDSKLDADDDLPEVAELQPNVEVASVDKNVDEDDPNETQP